MPGTSNHTRHKALVEKAPLSAKYVFGSHRNIEWYAVGYTGFKGIAVGELTKKTVKSWLLWLAEQVFSGRKIVHQAVQAPINGACKNEVFTPVPTS